MILLLMAIIQLILYIKAYADNTGGSFDSSANPTDITTEIDNVCNDVETNFCYSSYSC